MPIRKKTADTKDVVWTHFKITCLMPTYLISVLLYDTHSFPINDYDKVYDTIFHINTYFARRIIINVTRRFEIEWMAYSQNLSLTNHHIMPAGPQHNSMRQIIYRISNVIYVKELDPVSIKIRSACLIAHEVARQWINNLVSPSSWSDFWLNDGIARLLGMDMINKIFQDANYTSILDLFAVQSKLESLQLDHYLLGIMDPLIPKINKTSEIESLFSFSYYIKAPVILRILRQHLSAEVYLHGIEIFLNEHMFSSVTIDDFWGAMQAALNTAKLRNRFHVKWMMNTWTNQKHYPILKVEYSNCTSLRISIENFYQLVNDGWLLPIIIISIKWKENIIISIKRRYTYNKVQDDIPYIEIDGFCKKDELLIIDLQQGYYRVNYEPHNWRNIARYLNSGNYLEIDVHNRAQIIDDAFYFFSMQQLDMYSFLQLIKFLSQETNYVVWYPMIKALESMSKSFPIYNSEEKTKFVHLGYFKEKILKILNNVLERIGYEEEDSEEDDLIKCLRQEVVKWACTLEDFECLQKAKYDLEDHFFRHKRILAWWTEWTYCKGIQTETTLTGVWKIVLQEWIVTSNNRIWEFLTCITHPNSIKEYLNDKYLEVLFSWKNASSKFRNIDRVNRFLFTITKHAKNSEILDYILNNFDKLKPREVNINAALITLINNVYSEVYLQKIKAFVEKRIAAKYFLQWTLLISEKIRKETKSWEINKLSLSITKYENAPVKSIPLQ
ncbi:glutamyl aminopeptidase-like [Nylanderia fulva]|uniref:glutamyl aminopeptidase-like n=1 Tax=Nylanderia fulva TaxID=613905 RepID=UPI0010FB7DD6|nr:glutamyl aminopeptidase-like [Nylanderia fulva]